MHERTCINVTPLLVSPPPLQSSFQQNTLYTSSYHRFKSWVSYSLWDLHTNRRLKNKNNYDFSAYNRLLIFFLTKNFIRVSFSNIYRKVTTRAFSWMIGVFTNEVLGTHSTFLSGKLSNKFRLHAQKKGRRAW